MPLLPIQRLNDYRARTFRTLPQLVLRSPEQAVEFAAERGFIHFWPIQGALLPSLWTAVAGDRPVADAHDDPGHVTWGWKDELLGKRRWYYARILCRRNTILSLEMAPYFYALSENYGDPDQDYLIQYEEGRLTQEAKAVYEALLKEGALDSIALRKAARLTSRESSSRFGRAVDDLQVDFKILPVGTAEVGAWRYAFVYDLVTRHLPELAEQARPISEGAARREILKRYFRSVGAAQLPHLRRLFRWRPEDLQRALSALVQAGALANAVEVEGEKGEWLALPELT